MLSILDKSRTIPSWRDAPAVQKIVAELEVVSGDDVGAALGQAVLDASRRLAEVEAREGHQLATSGDVAAARSALATARDAAARHEERCARQADRTEASRTIAAEIILAAQRETAQRVADRGAAAAKRLVPLVRRALEEIDAVNEAAAYEKAYFSNPVSQRLDPIGNLVMTIGSYLPAGSQTFIPFSVGQGRDAVIHMRDWLRRMEARGDK